MNYLFVMPQLVKSETHSYMFPIGIAYVSASLKQAGRNVFTLNLNYKSNLEQTIRDVILLHDVHVVCTSGLTSQYYSIKTILKTVKAINPEIITVVGGGIITSDPVPAMEALELADYGIIGEGELTICELACELETAERDIQAVKGIIYRDKGNDWVITQLREEIACLDEIPFPDYEGFEFGELLVKTPIDAYAFAEGSAAYVSFGRSCPYRCTFCFHPSGTKYRKRSLSNAFQEVDWLVSHYGIKNIVITDELFARDFSYVEEFCQQIKQRELGFAVSLRVDNIDEALVKILKESGCLSINLGLESADNRVLKSMRKNITIAQIENALNILSKYHINLQGNFIFGDVEESLETARNTLAWWKAHPEYFIKLGFITVYPGSELYHIACKKGIIKDKVQYIKDGCPIINLTKMSDCEFRSLAQEIETLSSATEEINTVFHDASITYIGDGKVSFQAKCPSCGGICNWSGLDVFRPLSGVFCQTCSKHYYIFPYQYLNEIIYHNLSMLRNNKIAIWPMLDAVENLYAIAPDLINSENIYIVDSSKYKQGTKFHEKQICSPDIIEQEAIEIVFLSLTTITANEIIEIIQAKFKNVSRIHYLGDLVNPNFGKVKTETMAKI